MNKKVYIVFTYETPHRVLLCRCDNQMESILYGRFVFGNHKMLISALLPDNCPKHGYLSLDLSSQIVDQLFDNDYVEITQHIGEKIDHVLQSVLQDQYE